MDKEYRVDIKIRNNLLLSAIENAGFKSVTQFCKAANIQSTSVYGLVSLKESPLRQDGTFTLVAQKILDYLCALPEDLWTEEQLWNTLTINTGRVLLDKHQMSVLTYGGEEEVLTLEDVVYIKSAWWGRYSAPGYLDCTDWQYDTNRRRLERTLRDYYGNE